MKTGEKKKSKSRIQERRLTKVREDLFNRVQVR